MALWCDHVDTMVARVSHKDVAVTIRCDPPGTVELSNGFFSVLMAPFTSTRQSGHMALWCDVEDMIVASVTHDDVAVPIHCDSNGNIELKNSPFSVSMARRMRTACSAYYCGHLVHPLPFFNDGAETRSTSVRKPQ
jgi:hypothetical protein